MAKEKVDVKQAVLGAAVGFLFSNTFSWLLGLIIALGVYFSNLGADEVIKKNFVLILAVLSGVTSLALFSWLRTYLKYGRFREAFGMLWDRKFSMRCKSCRKYLKQASNRTHLFYCSDPECNSKYVLTDGTGARFNKQEAVRRIKKGLLD